MIELDQILTGLVQRTEEGRLKWSRSPHDDQFVTSVETISIVIIEFDARDNNYRLDIHDETGQTVESLGYQDTSPEQDRTLARLYVLARRSAFDIDATLEKLAKGLEL